MDDLISRQAAIDYFVTNVGFSDEDGYPIEDSDELRKIWTDYFDGIPSAERRGRWIPQEYMSEIDSFIYTEYECSNCGEISKKKSNYCPDCGAKMDEEEHK